MTRHFFPKLILTALAGLLIPSQAFAMRGKDFKIIEPLYEKAETYLEAPQENCLKSLNAFILEYEKTKPLSQSTKNFCQSLFYKKAILKKELKSEISFIEQCSKKELIELLDILNFLCLNPNASTFLEKALSKRLFEKKLEITNEDAKVIRRFETKHLKTLLHQTLVKMMESAKKECGVVKLNEDLKKIFAELPERLKDHFTYKGCVIDCNTPLSEEKILWLKKWLAKKVGPENIQKIINLLRINKPAAPMAAWAGGGTATWFNGILVDDEYVNSFDLPITDTFYVSRAGIYLSIFFQLYILKYGFPNFNTLISALCVLSPIFGITLGVVPNPLNSKLIELAKGLKEELEQYK